MCDEYIWWVGEYAAERTYLGMVVVWVHPAGQQGPVHFSIGNSRGIDVSYPILNFPFPSRPYRKTGTVSFRISIEYELLLCLSLCLSVPLYIFFVYFFSFFPSSPQKIYNKNPQYILYISSLSLSLSLPLLTKHTLIALILAPFCLF